MLTAFFLLALPNGLILLLCKAKKLALPTVTNSRKAEILACRSLIYSHNAEICAWKF